MLAEKNESIKKSIVTLKELTADEKAKIQMEARERYRRDLVAALDFVREEKEEEIKELKDNLQQTHVENAKLQKENDAMSERIRFLEEQLTKFNK